MMLARELAASSSPIAEYVMTKSGKKKVASSRSAKRDSKSAARASAKAPARGTRGKPVVIDVHAHMLVPEVLQVTYEHSQYAQSVAGAGEGGRPGRVPEHLLKRMTEL